MLLTEPIRLPALRRKITFDRMEQRTEKLIATFDECLACFDRQAIFSGPSAYFYNQALAMVRGHQLADVLENTQYLEYVYASLASWGLHKNGETDFKLDDFDSFRAAIAAHKEKFLHLQYRRIMAPEHGTMNIVQLIKINDSLRISHHCCKFMYNSKLVHHILPDLMPPIDRQHTLLFFYNSPNRVCDNDCFAEIYRRYARIAAASQDILEQRVERGAHMSLTMAIHNAIIGYIFLNNLKNSRPWPARAATINGAET